jgi:hypothetical protein
LLTLHAVPAYAAATAGMLCTQILIQLKRFNQSAQAAVAARARVPLPGAGSSSSSRAKTRPGAAPLEQDLGSILGTPDSDTAAIDTSVGGKARFCVLSCMQLLPWRSVLVAAINQSAAALLSAVGGL